MEGKKIKIKKTFKTENTNQNQSKETEQSKIEKNLQLLKLTLKKIENKYKTFGFNDSQEEDFFEKNKGKKITIILSNNSKVEGKLHAIDKYRIAIEENNIIKYYFKHAILCFYQS
ncbi:MAG TPA: RNA chaperone Hfq [Spirochaetota bacterium]|nr:RNA chaperone Hfq [Spirochaetota bacterium]HOM38940.1 RNA chaperone Hfq [Spirochaetota bacterium]HPQ49198.1 RNA chaperone Hfq [Spirochaetota bacterium]